MMNASNVMQRVGDAYLPFNRPDFADPTLRPAITRITALAPEVDAKLIAELIAEGESWRERLVGLVFAANSDLPAFVNPMIASLRDPRGLAIVPTCAAIAVALSQQAECMPSQIDSLDPESFSGELGWALDNVRFHLGHACHKPQGKSPNDGKDFDTHVNLVKLIQDTHRDREPP